MLACPEIACILSSLLLFYLLAPLHLFDVDVFCLAAATQSQALSARMFLSNATSNCAYYDTTARSGQKARAEGCYS